MSFQSVPCFDSETAAFTSSGSNQRPLRLRMASTAAPGPCAVKKTSSVCERFAMRDKQRNLFAAAPVRISAAVPVLVQAMNAGSHRIGEAQLLGDMGSALAANLHQVAGILLLRGSHLKKPLHAIAGKARPCPRGSAHSAGFPIPRASSRWS